MHNAFRNCYNLTQVSGALPANMNDGFHGCNNLTTVVQSGGFLTGYYGINCFKNCTSLTNINTGVTMGFTFSNNMFENCTNLVDAGTSMSMTYFPSIFANCTNLTKAPSSIAGSYGRYAFRGCTKLVDGPNIFNASSDSVGAFENCYNMVNGPKNVYAGSNMQNMFANCYKMQKAPNFYSSAGSAQINTNTSNIQNGGAYRAFYECRNMTTGPNLLSSWNGYEVFYNC